MARKVHQYKVIVEQDEDGFFVASVPALPGCHTQAKNLTQLMRRVRDAVRLCLEVAKRDPQYRAAIKALSYEPHFVGLETLSV